MTEPETGALGARGRDSATAFCHLLIPAYNEAGRIRRCLQAVYDDALPPGYAWRDWSVLDDNSEDGTASLALEWGSQHPAVPLSVLSDPRRLGKSARLSRAHETLLQRSTDPSELVVVLDADALITPGSLAALLTPFAYPEARLAVVWGADLPDDRSVSRWASVFQMVLTLELAKRLGDRRPRAYGRLFAYRLFALAEFTWQPDQVDDLQLSEWVSHHGLPTVSAWNATVAVAPASGWRDFYLQTYRSYHALSLQRPGLVAEVPLASRLEAAMHVARQHPHWALAYLAARAAAATQDRLSHRVTGPVWEPARSTKSLGHHESGGNHESKT